MIRHGQSTWNAEGRIQGTADPPLSATGRRQADALSARLRGSPIAAVYSSPAVRCNDTAEAIAIPHKVRPRISDALLEVDLGTWEGKKIVDLTPAMASQYLAWERDPSRVHPPEGETLEAASSRVLPGVLEMASAHSTETFVIVTHSIIGRVIVSHLLGANTDLVPRLRIKKASITKLRIENGFAVLERLSDTGHLRGV